MGEVQSDIKSWTWSSLIQADVLLAVQLSQKCRLLICLIPGVPWANSHSQFFSRHTSMFCCISLLSCSLACWYLSLCHSLYLSLSFIVPPFSSLSGLGFVCFGFSWLWWGSETFLPFSKAILSNWKPMLGNILIYPEVLTIGLRPYPWLDTYFKADFNWPFSFLKTCHNFIFY